jgi:hypothetical protein
MSGMKGDGPVQDLLEGRDLLEGTVLVNDLKEALVPSTMVTKALVGVLAMVEAGGMTSSDGDGLVWELLEGRDLLEGTGLVHDLPEGRDLLEGTASANDLKEASVPSKAGDATSSLTVESCTAAQL